MKRLVLLAAAFLIVTPMTARAQTVSGFGLRPLDSTLGYFQYRTRPGAILQDTLEAVNPSDTALVLNVSVSRASTADSGGLVFDDVPPEVGEPGTWVAIKGVPGPIGVPPHGTLQLPFTLTIPPAIRPGEYLFGFMAAQTDTEPTLPAGSGFQIRVVARAVVTVKITIPGGGAPAASVQDVALQENDAAGSRAMITILNTSAVGWQGQGVLTLFTQQHNTVVSQQKFKVGYVLPGASIRYPLSLGAALQPGLYRAEVTLGEGTPAFTKYLRVADPPSETLAPTTTPLDTDTWPVPDPTAASIPLPVATDGGSFDNWPLALTGLSILALVTLGAIFLLTRRSAGSKNKARSAGSGTKEELP